ncbi:NADH:flavin oxidoreductase [Methanosalsum natronophilum]|uniref:NADH:flavin oxidoreductase n=1 Tax=Methanosalsum natronophilum TaxID=768733 RepID=A0A424YS63_9EURY|nr:MAG: NADH:flavin oxidoreductase [Methanosalsum natronophilum]
MLFESIKIGNLNISNRFVRSATHEWLAEEDGNPTSKIGDIYEELARNEVGLIVTGYSYISYEGKSAEKQQGIHSDYLINGYIPITKRIKNHYDSKLIIQLVHGGRQSLVTSSNPIPKAPSSVRDTSTNIKPQEMTEKDIYNTIDDFATAAKRAKKAGFDGVQLHCAHGFLLSSFLSAYTNRRNDQWGGSIKNRVRIIDLIVKKIRNLVGNDFPILVKLNATDGFDIEKIPESLDLPECVEIAKCLEDLGIAAIEISGGIFEAGDVMSQPNIDLKDKEAYFKKYSLAIKREVNIPIILVGGIRSIDIMQQVINNKYADMISMSRPFIVEPDLVKSLKNGITKKTICTSCNLCFDRTGIKCNYEF